MNVAPLGEVKAKFSAYVRKAQDGPIVVTKNGKPIVLMLRIQDDEDLERLLLANSPMLQAMLDAAEARIHSTGGLSHEDVWSTLENETD
jgi:prevent-host-death family protein